MAVDKLVDSSQLDADLTSVADAIRTKGGTSSQMAFPAGFVLAVQAIPTGITPTGTKSITENGTHDVTQYASASVSVPNSYAAGDEGKVVSNGALVAQSSDTVTENDTYDTTLINSLTVNVSGGGGFDLPLTYLSSSVVVRSGMDIQPTFPIVNGGRVMGVVHDSGNPTWFMPIFARYNADGSRVWYGGWVNQGSSYNNYQTTEGETTYTPAKFSFFTAWKSATTETVDYYLLEES